VVLLLITPGIGSGSRASMRGPQEELQKQAVDQEAETSCFTLAFLGAIKFYQQRISPIGGPDRCGFRPSCSAYGVAALREQGPLIGLLMIGDRQVRCHIWKRSGPDYMLLPNGKLFDPPSKNLVFE
jgi:putative membrane protein insertion efficiency factor